LPTPSSFLKYSGNVFSVHHAATGGRINNGGPHIDWDACENQEGRIGTKMIVEQKRMGKGEEKRERNELETDGSS
jgi:hypothetical protein